MTMDEIFEIRDACKTPIELLKSSAFTKYLNIYKKKFISELEGRKDSAQKKEIIHKIEFIKAIKPSTFVNILMDGKPMSGDELMQSRQNVKFIDGY